MKLAIALCVLLVFPVSAGAATIPVPPGGDLSAAYQAAQTDDVIQLQTGAYGAWTTPTGSKAVTVRADVGQRPVFRQLVNRADNITFDGLHVDGNGQRAANPNLALFETGGRANVTFRNGSVGNVVDQKGAMVGGQKSPEPLGVVFDNVDFYMVRAVTSGVHNECMYIMAAGTVVRNSRFDGTCGNTGAVLTQRGSWWGQQPWHGLEFVGNTFGRQLHDHGSINFGNHCGDVGAVCRGVVIRGNRFDPASMPENATPGLTYTDSVESCNTPAVDTLPGIKHEACEPSEPAPEPTPGATPAPTPAPTPGDVIAELERLVSELRGVVDVLTAERSALAGQVTRLQAEHDALQAVVVALEAENADFASRIDQALAALED